jgi:hypothetical protein
MKFKELTDKQVKKVIKLYNDTSLTRLEKFEKLVKTYDINTRQARHWFEDYLRKDYSEHLVAEPNKIRGGRAKFDTLTKKDIKFFSETYWDKSKPWETRMRLISDKFNVGERNVRKWAVKLGITQNVTAETSTEQLSKAKEKDFDKTKKVFMFTSAQNATEVHKGFLKSMEGYSEFHNADIIVIPIRYHNPGLIISENDKDQEWWDENVVKYLSTKRHKINNNVTVLSDVKVQPTASMPLNGFESLAGSGSAILAHPRVHMKSLPVLGGIPKMLFTTGVCTLPNYTETRAGKIGEFHHSFGFVIVEVVDDETYYIRQVIAKSDGSFNDLYYNVKDGVVTRNDSCAAIVKGDVHYGSHNKEVLERSFGELIPKLKPDNIILHDVFDGYSINPHEQNNWIMNYQKSMDGTDTLKTEVDNLITWLKSIKDLNIVITFSNHDDFLNRFILNANLQKLSNPKNALDFVEYAQVLLENKAPNGLIAYKINKEIPEIRCLGRNDSFIVNGWELAVHGMDGSNGSRGSIQPFKKLNTHIITAHGHSVFRYDGALQVGTNSEYRLSYNNGMSSWVQSDVIIHNDKKAQHIFYIGPNKEFTTFK